LKQCSKRRREKKMYKTHSFLISFCGFARGNRSLRKARDEFSFPYYDWSKDGRNRRKKETNKNIMSFIALLFLEKSSFLLDLILADHRERYRKQNHKPKHTADHDACNRSSRQARSRNQRGTSTLLTLGCASKTKGKKKPPTPVRNTTQQQANRACLA
jgi:hypothetical protein